MRGHILQNNDRNGPELSGEQAVKELKELRAFTSSLLESAPLALIILNKKWRIIYLNDEAKGLFEKDEKELIYRPLSEVYPRNLGFILKPESLMKMIDEGAKKKERYSSYLHKWFKVSVHSSDIGVIIRLEDITATMLVNRIYRLNEFSIYNMKDMVFWFKLGGHIIYSNKSARELLGYDAEELTGMKVYDIDPGFTWDMWQEHVKDIMKASSITFETVFHAKDGSDIPVEMTCNYLDYSGDEYIVAVVRDITERKKFEEALKNTKAEAELYLDLISHDINNMNQISLGYLEIAMGFLSGDESLQELLSKPIGALKDSASLIENVNKLRKLNEGGLSIEHMDLRGVLEETIKSFSGGVDKEVIINFHPPPGSCKIAANGLIKDVFSNLIINSIKHSVSDRVHITIGLEFLQEDDRRYCEVSVEDDGPGIPDKFKARLFNKYQRGGTMAQGRGMGLYLVKSLVEDFHGKVWVEDRVKGDHTKGAKFVVMLPVAEYVKIKK